MPFEGKRRSSRRRVKNRYRRVRERKGNGSAIGQPSEVADRPPQIQMVLKRSRLYPEGTGGHRKPQRVGFPSAPISARRS